MRLLTVLAFPFVLRAQYNCPSEPGGARPCRTVVMQCNVVGDKSHDDTAGIQACIDSTPDYGEIVFPPGHQMKITGTLNINGRSGLYIHGSGGAGGSSVNSAKPTFYWFGPDGGGPMLNIDRSDDLVLEGLGFFNTSAYNATSTGGANVIINVDKTLSAGRTATNDSFLRITIVSGTTNPNFQGIVFAQKGRDNVEHMVVRDSVIRCSYGSNVGQGIVIGPGGFYNAKRHRYERNAINNCATGIYLTGGSADIIGNNFNENVTHIYAHPIDPIRIADNDSENATQFLIGAPTEPITIENNRIAAAVHPPPGQATVWFTAGGSQVVTFRNNKFDPGPYRPIAFAANVGGFLYSSGNNYPDSVNTLAGLNTTPYDMVSVLDHLSGYNSPEFIVGGGYFHHLGALSFNGQTQRWFMSNDLLSPGAALGHTVVTEPAAGFTFSGTDQLGDCTSGTDLVISGPYTVYSPSRTFSSNDAGGFLTIDQGTGWNAGNYLIAGAGGANVGTSNVVGTVGATGGTYTINRGRMLLQQGKSGAADSLWVCTKTAFETYAWKQVF